MITSRRSFLIGAGALVTAPMIVRAEALMPVRVVDLHDTRCLINYNISADEYVLRIDRALHPLVRPEKSPFLMEVPLSRARELLPPAVYKLIMSERPPAGVQRYLDYVLPYGVFA